jgi:hypothetical protein
MNVCERCEEPGLVETLYGWAYFGALEALVWLGQRLVRRGR